MEELNTFLSKIENSLKSKSFIKITLSKPKDKKDDLTNVYIKPILLKNELNLSFTYRHKTNDQVKNYSKNQSIELLNDLINSFTICTLFTNSNDHIFQVSKKGKPSLRTQKKSIKEAPSLTHDREKLKRSSNTAPYLKALGVTDSEGSIIPKMADKYRQINKYLEIIESLIKDTELPEIVNIVDMGSGKGYLTFALYDYLVNTKKLKVTITGIELRDELVSYCNDIAQNLGFNSLNFVCQPIEKYDNNAIDILIALHACDTATDDAIYKGLSANASIIVCAPCCHKQIRKQVKGMEQESPLLKFGIFKERQFEMVTDTIRALILEQHNYTSKVFEFISNEHTRKNIMLVGVKSLTTKNTDEINEKITSLKGDYQIQEHYLEKLLND